MTKDLEDMTLVYEGLVEHDEFGKVICELYSKFSPSHVSIVQESIKIGDEYLYKKKYKIYVPTEDYELSSGIC